MFDFLSPNPAVALLKKDHKKVKGLFDEFEGTDNRARKVKIVREALQELKVHAAIEEEIFYPAVRGKVGKELMNEADEEHHVAKLLIAELSKMKGSETHFDAKFQVLAENVRHHIREEENEMLPKAKEARLDFEKLTDKMMRRKQKLMKNGVPPAAEDKLIRRNGRSADSPARAATRKRPPNARAR